MVTRVTLSDLQRAELYLGLGRALSAGLSATQALDALQGICGGTLDTPLRCVVGGVRKGTALALSLDRHGLVGKADYALLANAENTGSMDRACERLASRYNRSGIRWRRMKGRLMFPAALLVIAILVLPLPAVVAGSLGVGVYVLQAGVLLALLAALATLSSMLVRHWRAHGTPGLLTRIARLLPGTASMSRLHERADACERLALAHGCGVPVLDAMDAMCHAEGNGVRRAALVAARGNMGGGAGVADAMQRAGLLDASGFAIVSAGESAGRLDDTLGRIAAQAYDELDDRYALLAQWIPVAVYLGVAGTIAVGLIG